jgi:two-component system, cell cycle response regulator
MSMNRKLLVIDDDRAIHQLVGAHLANSQTDFFFASDGIEGIHCAINNKPTAILLDMEMPYMTGLEVCAKLKADPMTRDIPIVFVTSDATTRSKVRGIEMGAIDYVTKPFDPFELRARVGSVFRTASAIQSAQTLPGIDEATGLWNRAFLMKQIESLVAASARNKLMVSCCFVAIDRFDELAQKMGQPGGADLIQEARSAICASVRLEDFVCRYDARVTAGLGFAANPSRGQILARRLLTSVGGIGMSAFIEPEPVTCSIGMSISHASVGPRILAAAEWALAQAQLQGNHLIIANPDREEEPLCFPSAKPGWSNGAPTSLDASPRIAG